MAISKRTIIEISPKTMLWALLIGVLVVLLFMVRDILAVLIFAIIISSALEPLLQYSENKKIPRLLSLIVIYLLFFVFFAALINIRRRYFFCSSFSGFFLPVFIQRRFR